MTREEITYKKELEKNSEKLYKELFNIFSDFVGVEDTDWDTEFKPSIRKKNGNFIEDIEIHDEGFFRSIEVRRIFDYKDREADTVTITVFWDDLEESLTYENVYLPGMSNKEIINKSKELLNMVEKFVKITDDIRPENK